MARRRFARFVLGLGLLVVVVCAAFVALLPRIVKSRVISAAAAHGVALSIDDLSLTIGRARLTGVHASALVRSDAKGAPNASASAQTVEVTLDGLTPTAMTVTGMHLDLDGSASDVAAALTPRDKSAAAESPLKSVTINDASLKWTHPFPTDRIAVDATHVSGEIVRSPERSLGEDFHFEAPELRAFTKEGLPPWSATAARDASGTRFELGLPKKARVVIALGNAGTRTIDIDTPDASAAELGIPAELLGLYGDETSRFEVHLHHQQADAETASGAIVATATDVFLGQGTNRTSFAIDARYAGNPKTALRINAGTLRAGPFTGALIGGFALDPAVGFKANLQYSSGIMSCLDAAKSQAASYGGLAKGVAALAGMLGLDHAVEGRIVLKGDIEVDTRTNQNRFAFHTEGDCKLGYLPSL